MPVAAAPLNDGKDMVNDCCGWMTSTPPFEPGCCDCCSFSAGFPLEPPAITAPGMKEKFCRCIAIGKF